MKLLSSLMLAVAMSGIGQASAQVYKCEGAGGAKVFQQHPCTNGIQTQTKTQADTAFKPKEQVAHCKIFSRKYADWAASARRDFKAVGGKPEDLQKHMLTKNKFSDGGELMTARASMLLTTQLSEEEMVADLYSVCMTETWSGERASR